MAALVAFVLVERRAAEPVLPLWVLGNRTLVAANLAALVVGVLTLGLTSYVPVFAQGVLGHGAIVGGLALAAMTIGWPVAASISGRFYLTIGFRLTLLMGGAFAVAGAALLLPVDASSSVWALAGPCFVMGLGFGFVASPSVIAAQSTVTWQHRGVVTGANMFARSIGSALGVAAFGAIANGVVREHLGRSAAGLEHVAAGVLEPALHDVFLASAGLALSLLLIGALMPSRIVEYDPAA